VFTGATCECIKVIIYILQNNFIALCYDRFDGVNLFM